MLSLLALHGITRSAEHEDIEPSKPVQLIDVDRFLNDYGTIDNRQAILRDMVWSFYRAASHALSPDKYSLYLRFLDSALAAVSTSEQNPNRILDHYWMKRLLSPVSHADAVVQVWEDAQSLPASVKSPMKHTEIEKRLSDFVDGKAGDERSNYSTKSTRVGNMPLVKHTKDEYSVYNHKRHTSLSWWSTILRALG